MAEIDVYLDDAATVAAIRQAMCPRCWGTGNAGGPVRVPCPWCDGRGLRPGEAMPGPVFRPVVRSEG